MGNASSVREDGGGAAAAEEEEDEEEEMRGSQNLLRQSPPSSPRGPAQAPPLLFTPQIPMAPLQLFDGTTALFQNSSENEDFQYGQGIPTMITWSYGGNEVAVTGSWDNWRTRILLQKSGKDFTIMKILPSGVYQYKFLVDGDWRYAPDLPWMHDDMGNAYNTLDLQESVPDDVENLAGFEPPQSPESSYDNYSLVGEDYAKEPPLVPPQLHLTLLNAPTEDSLSLSRPQHVVLNHLYIQKGQSSQPVAALGSTRRFMAKYVTVVLFKPLNR